MAEEPSPGQSAPSSNPKIVKVVRRDSFADGERDHFDRQIVKRAWNR